MKKRLIPLQPLTGTTLKNYWKVLSNNKFDVSKKHLSKAIYVGMISILVSLVNAIEKIFHQKQIKNTVIQEDPIFIIGHWRTGTTFLHYAMSNDKNLGYLTNAQAFCPTYMFYSFKKFINKIIGIHVPNKRPMDDMEMHLESPQEEEFALGNFSVHSAYHWWTFPNKMKEYFNKYVLFNSIRDEEIMEFKNNYLYLLKKLTLANHGKRLLLKNPPNTGRIPFLLKQFPNAKFIYLHRNPNQVYHSTVKLHSRLLECFSYQNVDENKIKECSKSFYTQLLEKYNLDKQLIPKDNLIEVSYHDLVSKPLESLQQIYEDLEIPDFKKAKPAFQNFINSQKDYRADVYMVSHQVSELPKMEVA